MRKNARLQAKWGNQELEERCPAPVDMFKALDVDGDGSITAEELATAPDEVMAGLMKYIHADSVLEGAIEGHGRADAEGMELWMQFSGVANFLEARIPGAPRASPLMAGHPTSKSATPVCV